ncbi:MAG: metallophosphatase family protein [Acidobacteriales bacterium]|nr:metallophosphatase family protein [Terriglobales bacterium]
MRIGIVGDLHAHFVHPLYFGFIQETWKQYRVTHTVFIGDVVDLHALSFWEHNPNGLSAETEAAGALDEVQRWYKAFPRARVCIGNHDERHHRVARKAGLPDRFIRTYADVWQTPKWNWQFEHLLDGVLYQHGTGTSGKDAAFNQAVEKRVSVVQGHTHTDGGFKYHTNHDSRIFGMNVGCGFDLSAYAFAYGRTFARRPVLGCGIVIDGEQPHFVPMPCGRGEKYHRSRAGKRKR